MTIRIGLPAFLLLCASVCTAQSAEDSGNCHEELSSIDISEGSWNAINNNRYRFKHVFQSTDEYPFFEYIGGAMVGIASSRWYPDSIIPNFNYWTNLDGRTGSPSGNHYSIVDEIYGRGNTHGISFSFSSSEEYAFLLFDHANDDIRESVDKGALIGQGFSAGTWGVLTLVNGENEFIKQDQRSVNLSCGSSRGYLYFGNNLLAFTGGNTAISHCAAYAAFDSNYGNKYLRSINVFTQRVQIAGVEHTQRRICRRKGIPLAVTNSDTLRPVLEERLALWADRVNPSYLAYKAAEEEAEREEHRTRWVRVAEFRDTHRGNFHESGKNDVRIQFRNLNKGNVTSGVWADGHLIINGVDLGKIRGSLVGRVGGLFGKDKKWAEVQRKFGSGDFLTVDWTGTSTVYIRDDNRYLECDTRTCYVYVRASKLTEIGRRF